jgi:hypothetical protein
MDTHFKIQTKHQDMLITRATNPIRSHIFLDPFHDTTVNKTPSYPVAVSKKRASLSMLQKHPHYTIHMDAMICLR